mmetsp:Transcript_19637/g.45925  ORF Transcript_19637/g.45925 Transcript_19637/m.45925 type:complete len:823 (+) Transcript_19637:49-2517(+)|eukprot:CAMPEP_0114553122 /NCGR_PEP_ID=MMETSP0114-20121206/7487_1 /TAXON_ID=31324 /ORGANISM="Goniomonas sp, Strain m" /LENGTH=822 /DNA_ID=CAMNT_0001738039 /DNA_START=52 /DNA_END=2520 /DNA_ORIENTATION=+
MSAKAATIGGVKFEATASLLAIDTSKLLKQLDQMLTVLASMDLRFTGLEEDVKIMKNKEAAPPPPTGNPALEAKVAELEKRLGSVFALEVKMVEAARMLEQAKAKNADQFCPGDISNFFRTIVSHVTKPPPKAPEPVPSTPTASTPSGGGGKGADSQEVAELREQIRVLEEKLDKMANSSDIQQLVTMLEGIQKNSESKFLEVKSEIEENEESITNVNERLDQVNLSLQKLDLSLLHSVKEDMAALSQSVSDNRDYIDDELTQIRGAFSTFAQNLPLSQKANVTVANAPHLKTGPNLHAEVKVPFVTTPAFPEEISATSSTPSAVFRKKLTVDPNFSIPGPTNMPTNMPSSPGPTSARGSSSSLVGLIHTSPRSTTVAAAPPTAPHTAPHTAPPTPGQPAPASVTSQSSFLSAARPTPRSEAPASPGGSVHSHSVGNPYSTPLRAPGATVKGKHGEDLTPGSTTVVHYTSQVDKQTIVSINHQTLEMVRQIDQNTKDIDELIEAHLTLEERVKKKADIAALDAKASVKYCQELVKGITEALMARLAELQGNSTAADLVHTLTRLEDEVRRKASKVEIVRLQHNMDSVERKRRVHGEKNMAIRSLLFKCQACHKPIYQGRHQDSGEVECENTEIPGKIDRKGNDLSVSRSLRSAGPVPRSGFDTLNSRRPNTSAGTPTKRPTSTSPALPIRPLRSQGTMFSKDGSPGIYLTNDGPSSSTPPPPDQPTGHTPSPGAASSVIASVAAKTSGPANITPLSLPAVAAGASPGPPVGAAGGEGGGDVNASFGVHVRTKATVAADKPSAMPRPGSPGVPSAWIAKPAAT